MGIHLWICPFGITLRVMTTKTRKKTAPKSTPTPLFSKSNPQSTLKKNELEAEIDVDTEEEEEEEENEEIAVDEIIQTGETSLDIRALVAEAEKSAAFDIFSDLGQPLVMAGVPIVYEIRKNGMHAATENHPLNWDTIQKRYRGGSFHVILKRQNERGSWVAVKHQVNVMMDPLDAQQTQTPPLRLVGDPNQDSAPAGQPPTPQASSPLEQFSALQRIISEDRRMAREEMLAMQPQKQGNDLNLFLELFKAQMDNNKDQMRSFQDALKESNQANREMMKQLSDEVREVARASQKKDDGFGVKEALSMFKDAEERAERKSEKQLAFMDRVKKEIKEEMTDEPAEKVGIGTKLLEGLLPAIGPALKRSPGPLKNSGDPGFA